MVTMSGARSAITGPRAANYQSRASTLYEYFEGQGIDGVQRARGGPGEGEAEGARVGQAPLSLETDTTLPSFLCQAHEAPQLVTSGRPKPLDHLGPCHLSAFERPSSCTPS